MNPARLVLAAALLALALKLGWAATSIGTNDTVLFYMFGQGAHEEGLLGLYDIPIFNHTPLVGTFAGAIYGLADGNATLFAFLLRAPAILADFGTVLALLWLRRRSEQPPWWTLGLFALSPVSLMVSGFHGNIDSVLVLALTLAACACVARQPAACGLALALGCQVKIIALIAAPALLAWWWQQGRWRPFLFTTVLVTLVGWLVPLVTMPVEFLKHVLAYPSYWGTWGITMGLKATGVAEFQKLGFDELSNAQIVVGVVLKVVIIGGALALAWRRRSCDGDGVFGTLALTWVVFFVFAPGFGGQYLVWIAPFAAVYAPRWFAALTVASTVFLYRFYEVISTGWPWHHGVSTNALTPKWIWWTVLPWLVVFVWLVWLGWLVFGVGWRRRSD